MSDSDESTGVQTAREVISNPPQIIQGGMGAGVSWWYLAQAVAKLGQMGVVSGTALDLIMARRLQDGDPGGHIRRALDHFPFPEMANRVWERYYIPGGKPADRPYKSVPVHSVEGSRLSIELTIVSNFVEVFLAREGHDNPVGINYLEKIQLPHLPSIYGAMLAGVTYILMGAGIPSRIPGVLDRFVHHESASYPIYVAAETNGHQVSAKFNPKDFIPIDLPPLKRPYFLPIIASNTLADFMIRKSNGHINGFIIEGPTAGGHNAPPRGKAQFSESGEPVYGPRDVVDLEKIRRLGLPFWVAGSAASAARLREVLAAGGAGIQVGTAFAMCEESGLTPEYRAQLLQMSRAGRARVYTDAIASPTGFPFKVALVDGTMSEADQYQARNRICDLGYLREVYRKDDESLGYRCSSEPIEDYLAKGGNIEETKGRKCLCNALMSNVGHPQLRKDGYAEKPLFTSGDDLVEIGRFIPPGKNSYTAQDVIQQLLG